MNYEDKPIRFMRKDGSFAVNVVGAGGYDPETGEVIFHEIAGFSGDVRGGVYVDGQEKFKRILVQRVFPVIEDNYVLKEHNRKGKPRT